MTAGIEATTEPALLPAPRCQVAMLTTHVALRAGITRAASTRTPRAEGHSAWKHHGTFTRRTYFRKYGKAHRLSVAHPASSSVDDEPAIDWGDEVWESRNHEEWRVTRRGNHEDWRVCVRSLTGLTRRAALMATVGGLAAVGPARAEDVSSVNTTSSSEPSSAAAAAGLDDTAQTFAPVDDPWEGSYVKPAMTVSEYIEEVRPARSPTPFPPFRLPSSHSTRIVVSFQSGYFPRHLLVPPFRRLDIHYRVTEFANILLDPLSSPSIVAVPLLKIRKDRQKPRPGVRDAPRLSRLSKVFAAR